MKVLQKFYDISRRQEMCLAKMDNGDEWVCYKHPDGQYVTFRQATADDLNRIQSCVQELKVTVYRSPPY